MSKKHSQEYINSIYKAEGYTVLEPYRGLRSKMKVSCDRGHIHYSTPGNFMYVGAKCYECSLNKKSDLFRKDIGKLKKDLENVGLKWIAGEYKNNRSILTLECPKGHRFGRKCAGKNTKKQCPHCIPNSTKSPEAIQKRVDSRGFTLLTLDYKSHTEKVKWKCSKGHYWYATITLVTGAQKTGCPECFVESSRKSFEEVKKELEKEGYTLNEVEYLRAHDKLSVTCPNGHSYYTKRVTFISGYRCPYCAGTAKKTIEEAREVGIGKGMGLLSTEYKNSTSKLKWKCFKNDHITYASWSNINANQGCSKCFPGYSLEEQELAEWIESLDIKVIRNSNPDFMGGQELDIYMPDLKIAIEYNGLYWHSEEILVKKFIKKGLTEKESLKAAQYFHKNKTDMCKNAGVSLIHIWDEEWRVNKDKIKRYLRGKLKKQAKSIGARKCEIKEVDKRVSYKFLRKNHIQGPPQGSKISFGLYYEQQLLGVVVASTHHRGGHDKELVLSRLAFIDNVSIPGGASRLISHLKQWAKSQDYNKIVSWSDNRWSQGNVYKQTGWTKEKQHSPDYFYYDDKNKKIRSKHSSRKKDLRKFIVKKEIPHDPNVIDSLTETQLSEIIGLYHVWDCGKVRWSLTL